MNERETLYQIARMYYIEDATQVQIAERFGLSRPNVSRSLKRCRELGIVRIELTYPYSTNHQLQETLKRRFHLRDAVVVSNTNSPEGGQVLVGRAAAFYLKTLIRNGEVVGLSWGSTLCEVVQAYDSDPLDDVAVVQLMGGLELLPGAHQANVLVQRMADAVGGRPYFLYAPVLVQKEHARELLVQDRSIREILALGRRATVAVVGIGALDPRHPSALMSILPAEAIAELKQAGAIGEVCCQFYDADGKPCNTSLADRTVGISIADLDRIPTLIAVAHGLEKANAIRAALRGGWADVLVTDEATARSVLVDGNP
ncbi:MAG TPA: sugar-binding transcriptional regulator [Symbiobacteriaceae bacterium]|nr:sugar-binding transcriptional regulator [Symbiobacteriaceae bacterium]